MIDRRDLEKLLLNHVSILINHSVKDKNIPTCVKVEGMANVNLSLEGIKEKLTVNFAKREMTVDDIRKLDHEKI